MPEYNWIQSAEFEAAVRARIETKLQQLGVSGLPYTFTSSLVTLARDNRVILEGRKEASERTQADALRSVEALIEEAAQTVKRAGRSDVDQAALGAALTAKFCTVWPFCK